MSIKQTGKASPQVPVTENTASVLDCTEKTSDKTNYNTLHLGSHYAPIYMQNYRFEMH